MPHRTSRMHVAVMIAVVLASVTLDARAAEPAAWMKTAAGTYSWSVGGNWSAAVPNAPGVVADLNTGLQGNVIINLDQAITIGTLNAGDRGGAAGVATVIRSGAGGKWLVFEGAAPGAATAINLAVGGKPAGMGLNLAAGIRLGGTSPLTATVNSPAAFDCAIGAVDLNGNTFTLEGIRRFNQGSGWHGVNWQIGSISGGGSFVQNVSGTTIQGDCPEFTGTLTINNGLCTAGSLPAASQYVVAGAFINKDKYPRGGVLNLSAGHARPGQTTWSARLNPKATLVLRGGGHFICNGQELDEMAFFGRVRPAVVEQVRQIQFHSGMSEFALENGNHVSSSTTLMATDPVNALVRQQGATVMVSGDGLRTTQGYWAALGMAEKLLFASGMSSQLKGAGGPPGSTSRSIIPWMTIGTVYHPAEGGWATYDSVKGVHSLLEHDEYDDKLAGAPDRNVRCDQLNLGANKMQTVNSLCFGSWGNSDIGAGSTITITSGALMIGSMGGASIGGTPGAAGTLNFGPAEAVIWTPFVTPYGKDVTIGSTIAGSGGLTKSATSTLVLTGANTYTGKTCIAAGAIQVGDGKTAAAKLGDGDVEVASGAVLYIKAKVANGIADTATVTLCNVATAFYGMIDLDSGVDETVAGLVLDGKAQPAGTYGGKNSAAAHKLDNYFAGTGVLTVSGKATAEKP